MAADQTVSQLNSHNQHFDVLTPRHGVVTLFGYGIRVRLDQGHLSIEDGIGVNRRRCRLPRIGHGLKRLVVIGSDGMVSLAALRWLADQDASFVMLERDGSVLATTGPVRPSEAKLRRAQALAHSSGAALRIACELVSRKLDGQEHVVLHVDTSARDSLACDLMEPIRAQIDSYLLDWITRQPLRREWFCEQRDGNCRLAGSFTVRLSETAPIWRKAVAPIAEWVARAFWSTIRKPDAPLATRLTQNNKREAKGAPLQSPSTRIRSQENVCAGCGKLMHETYKKAAAKYQTDIFTFVVPGAKQAQLGFLNPVLQNRMKEYKPAITEAKE